MTISGCRPINQVMILSVVSKGLHWHCQVVSVCVWLFFTCAIFSPTWIKDVTSDGGLGYLDSTQKIWQDDCVSFFPHQTTDPQVAVAESSIGNTQLSNWRGRCFGGMWLSLWQAIPELGLSGSNIAYLWQDTGRQITSFYQKGSDPKIKIIIC